MTGDITMWYMGSKGRLATEILPIMLLARRGRQWVEPFVGGANLIQYVQGKRIGTDLNKWVIACLDAVSKGWMPKPSYNVEEYHAAKARVNADDTSNVQEDGYIGFCTFGGKFFGGFSGGLDKQGRVRNLSEENYKNCSKQFPKLLGVEFSNCDYRELQLTEPSLIYCDPPYKGTTKYKTDNFNYEEFYSWCCQKVEEGHIVFVSEYEVNHPRFHKVWEKEMKSSIRRADGSSKTEKLFRIV